MRYATNPHFTLGLLALLSLAPSAWAAPACVSADVCDAGADPCIIDADYEVGDLCTLDFGGRAVELGRNAVLDAAGGSFSLVAGALTADYLAVIKGEGGTVDVRVGGTVTSEGRIDLSGSDGGGSLTLTAAGDIHLSSRSIDVSGSGPEAGGGSIELVSTAGSISLDQDLDASGGSLDSGGDILVVAARGLTVGRPIDATGGEYDGGTVELVAGDALLVGAMINVNSSTNGGYGGTVILIGGEIGVDDVVKADGSSAGESHGSGGDISLTAATAITIDDNVHADGAGLEGDGGSVSLASGGTITVSEPVDATGNGSEASGGSVVLDAAGDVSVLARVDVSGKTYGGGDISIQGADVLVDGDVLANGTTGAAGGWISVSAQGALTVDDLMEAKGGRDGSGGHIILSACALAVTASGVVRTDAPDGTLNLTGASSLVLEGDLRADSEIALAWRDTPPVLEGAKLEPGVSDTQDPELTLCCPDADADGVCDATDACPDFPDAIDGDGDGVPNACDTLALQEFSSLVAGTPSELSILNALPGSEVHLVVGVMEGPFMLPGCATSLSIEPTRLLGHQTADGEGTATFRFDLPMGLSETSWTFQAAELDSCRVSSSRFTEFE
jgi:hypothetical protein